MIGSDMFAFIKTIAHKSLCGVAFSVIPCLAMAEAADSVTCDTNLGRCVSQISLVATNGDRISTLGIQIGKDGTEPVVFATSPLGSALNAGIQIVIGTQELRLAYDVCLQDGCRATKPLSAEEFALLRDATDAELRLMRYGNPTPLAMRVDFAAVVDKMKDSVKLP
jgi:invasion protein IalB